MLASSLANGALAFVVTLIVTRGLGAEQAGMFYVTVAVFSVCLTVLTAGADLGIVRTIARDVALGEFGAIRTTVRAAVVPVAAVSTLAAIGLVLFAPSLAPHLVHASSNGDITSLFRTVIAFVPLASISVVLIAATRGFGTMTPFMVSEQIGKPFLSALGVGLAFVIAGANVVELGLAWAAPNLVGLVYAALMLRRLMGRHVSDHRPDDHSSASIWREFWSFASVRALASIFQVLVRWLDVILVSSIASVRDAGIYAAISRLVLIGTVVQRAIIRVMGPRFSGLLAVGDRAGAESLYKTSTSWLTAVSFPFYLALAVFAPTVVLIFGTEFQGGATPLVILAIGMLVNVATGPAMTILLMAGKASSNLITSAGSLAINTALNVALIPTLGITGAAIAWCVSIVFQNLFPLWQILHTLHLHPVGPGVLASGGCALLIYGLAGGFIEAVFMPAPLGVAVITVALTGVYLAFLWHFRRLLAVDALMESVKLRPRTRVVAENS
jgi:O-antigen/teichoic acid export membrane protein